MKPKFDSRSWDQRIGESDAGAFAESIGKTCDSFDYDAVDSDDGRLCDKLSEAAINPTQARIILAWHTKEVDAEIHRAKATVMARVVARLIASTNVPLDLRALALASGIGEAVSLESEAQVARELNITRSAVSKCANKWADVLGYRVTKFLRNDSTRKQCSDAQKKDHWRNRI